MSMKTSRYLLLTLLVSFIAGIDVFAQTSSKELTTNILDKAASKLRKEGGVTVGFTISNANGSDKGTLDMLGKKFHSVMEGLETWYDGKSMWSYVSANEEVNLTKPKASELAKVNPYYFLDIYKKGYKLTKGNNTNSYYEVVMNSLNPKSSISKAVIRVDRQTYHIKYIKVTNAKNIWLEINVTSYKKGQKFPAGTFAFNKAKHPNADVIDLR